MYPGNTYDYPSFNESVKAQFYNNVYGPGNCVDMLKDCYARGIDEICTFADNYCLNEVENLYDIYLGRDEYDMRELSPDPFPYAFYIAYLNSPAVQTAIGAFQNYSESSSTVGSAFGSTGDDARLVGTISDIRSLLRKNITVMLYSGDVSSSSQVVCLSSNRVFRPTTIATGSAGRPSLKKSTTTTSPKPATSTYKQATALHTGK